MAVAAPIRVPQLVRSRVDLLGTQIDRIEQQALTDWIQSFIASRTPHQVITANLDFIAIARRKPDFAWLIQAADLVVCDGKPLQWASMIQGEAIPARVTGMDLVMETARLSAARGYRLFLLGAAPGIAARAGNELERLIPGVVIAGVCSPRLGAFDAEEDARIVAEIRAAQPDALFVALGAPRQDEWIHEHLHELDVPLCAGIGGVFNFLAGETQRAPQWIQDSGFEWAYRLMQEPSRLWRRYFLNDLPIFFELLARQAAKRAKSFGAHQRPAHTAQPETLRLLAEAAPGRTRRAADLRRLRVIAAAAQRVVYVRPRVRKRACRSAVSARQNG